jgi:hypothetical protein
MFRKNLVDALRREQDMKMRITPGSEIAEGILLVLKEEGIQTLIFKDDEFILIHKNKATVRSREYIAVSATEKENSNIIPFMGYDNIKYPEYFPETDTFEVEDTTVSCSMFRKAIKEQREFFVVADHETIEELVFIAADMGLDTDMVKNAKDTVCFAFCKGEPCYTMWDTITEGVTERYIPEDDNFIAVNEEEAEQIEQVICCEDCTHLEDGGCTETEGNCPMQQGTRVTEETKPMSREITFNPESDCHVNGHSLVHMVRFDNGTSAWGDMICQKCGKTYSWQYDYNPNAYAGHEPKAF